MKRTDQIFLAVLGGGALLAYLNSNRECHTEWNGQTECRSHSSYSSGSGGGHYGSSNVQRGGFGRTGGSIAGGG